MKNDLTTLIFIFTIFLSVESRSEIFNHTNLTTPLIYSEQTTSKHEGSDDIFINGLISFPPKSATTNLASSKNNPHTNTYLLLAIGIILLTFGKMKKR